MKKWIAIGATSWIVENLLRKLAPTAEQILLVGRDLEKLNRIQSHLQSLNPRCKVEIQSVDLTSGAALDHFCTEWIPRLKARWGTIDGLVLGHGIYATNAELLALPLGEQLSRVRSLFDVNLTSYATLLQSFTPWFLEQNSGRIAIISSVAGDRGRASNSVYGATKAGLNTLTEGIRYLLPGVQVLLVKPGFVDTPMTAHLKKGLLWASADRVATDIFQALQRGKVEIYTPFFWRWILWILCKIPGFLFRHLKI